MKKFYKNKAIMIAIAAAVCCLSANSKISAMNGDDGNKPDQSCNINATANKNSSNDAHNNPLKPSNSSNAGDPKLLNRKRKNRINFNEILKSNKLNPNNQQNINLNNQQNINLNNQQNINLNNQQANNLNNQQINNLNNQQINNLNNQQINNLNNQQANNLNNQQINNLNNQQINNLNDQQANNLNNQQNINLNNQQINKLNNLLQNNNNDDNSNTQTKILFVFDPETKIAKITETKIKNDTQRFNKLITWNRFNSIKNSGNKQEFEDLKSMLNLPSKEEVDQIEHINNGQYKRLVDAHLFFYNKLCEILVHYANNPSEVVDVTPTEENYQTLIKKSWDDLFEGLIQNPRQNCLNRLLGNFVSSADKTNPSVETFGYKYFEKFCAPLFMEMRATLILNYIAKQNDLINMNYIKPELPNKISLIDFQVATNNINKRTYRRNFINFKAALNLPNTAEISKIKNFEHININNSKYENLAELHLSFYNDLCDAIGAITDLDLENNAMTNLEKYMETIIHNSVPITEALINKTWDEIKSEKPSQFFNKIMKKYVLDGEKSDKIVALKNIFSSEELAKKYFDSFLAPLYMKMRANVLGLYFFLKEEQKQKLSEENKLQINNL